MILFSKLPYQKIPSAMVDHLLTTHGFVFTGIKGKPLYVSTIKDAATRLSYRLFIPIDKTQNTVQMGSAFFEQDQVPVEVIQAAQCKLNELTDYVYGWAQLLERINHDIKLLQNCMYDVCEDVTPYSHPCLVRLSQRLDRKLNQRSHLINGIY